MAVYFGRNKTYRQPLSFLLAYFTFPHTKTPTPSSQKLYNKFIKSWLSKHKQKGHKKMEITNYNELGMEEAHRCMELPP